MKNLNPGLALMAKVAQHAQHPHFCAELEQLVARHEALLQQEAYRARQCETLRDEGPRHRYGATFLDLGRRRSIRYAGREWVPDSLCALESMGLVRCETGPCDSSGLPTRTVFLTTAGQAMFDALQARALAEATLD